MYTSFFGLNEKPFTITPDPRYLFMSERHGEGLAHLVYGVTESGGFIQLTGEVGTGKTTLVRTLLGQIPAEVDIALILNPQLSAVEFLTAICEELSVALPTERFSSKALVDALNQHLLDAHARGRRVILLVDEAQNLSEAVLEQLRLLTNLETARQKLLQIILIAQPELREKLAQQSLRQLAQRVTGRYHLEPLSRDETSTYIDHRLKVAGALTEIFDPAAKREVYRLSGGVPRVVNVICDRALLGAYSRETRTVSKRMVRKAAAEVSGQTVPSMLVKWLMPAIGVASLAIACLIVWRSLDDPDTDVESAVAPVASASAEVTAEDANVGSASDIEEVVLINSDALDELLADTDDRTGFAHLLSLWNVDYDPELGSACEQAKAAGLACLFQKGTLATLRQLDRPVMLSLTDRTGTSHQIALVGLDERRANLMFDQGDTAVPTAGLNEFWFGQFLIVWRPPNGRNEAISPGMQNDNVVWLKQSLSSLMDDYDVDAQNSSLFDDELRERLISFQRQHRLEADGVAGSKTQIVINSLLATSDGPRLSSGR